MPGGTRRPAAFAEEELEHDHGPGSIDALVEELIAEGHAEAASRDVLAPVEDALNGASSLDDLRRRLDAAEAGGDLRAMADSLARAVFAGRAAGALGAPVEDEEEA